MGFFVCRMMCRFGYGDYYEKIFITNFVNCFWGCNEDSNDEPQSDTLVIEVIEEREDCYESRIKFVGQGDNNI